MRAKAHPKYIDGRSVYACQGCHAHLVGQDDVISRAFHGQYGQAYLVLRVINISLGPNEERMMATGVHTVADIFCTMCHTKVGWKYIKAHDDRQHYKQGKYVVEKAMLIKEKYSDFDVEVWL